MKILYVIMAAYNRSLVLLAVYKKCRIYFRKIEILTDNKNYIMGNGVFIPDCIKDFVKEWEIKLYTSSSYKHYAPFINGAVEILEQSRELALRLKHDKLQEILELREQFRELDVCVIQPRAYNFNKYLKKSRCEK